MLLLASDPVLVIDPVLSKAENLIFVVFIVEHLELLKAVRRLLPTARSVLKRAVSLDLLEP